MGLNTEKLFSNCCGNPQMPLALPFFTLPNNTIATAAHKFFRFIDSLASRNPLINNLLSLPSQFHNLCVQIGKQRNVATLSGHNFAAVLPADSVAGVVVANGVQNFLQIYNTLLIVRLVLTWFPNTPPSIVSPFSTICDPYLNIFRGIIPPLGGTLDLSPILAFLVLNAFTSSAAALSAELPATEQSQEALSAPLHFTTSQSKWMRRLLGNRSRTSGDAK